MPILTKGYTFTSTEQVTSVKLGNLVDNATFASGAIDGISTDLSSGSIIVKNGGITPTKLSTGAPTWTTDSNLTVNGTLTTGGNISTSNGLNVSGSASISTNLSVTGTSAFTGNSTFSGQIIAPGTSTGLTVPMATASASPNAISFGWNSGDLLVRIDSTDYKVTLTPV